MPKDYIAKPTRKRAPSFKQELKVLAVLVVFVALLEIISRVLAPTLDYDREHIHAFPEIVEKFQQKEMPSDKVTFLGNSLMMHGLDLKLTQNKYDDKGRLTTTKLTPVGTAITDWTYLYKRYFPESTEQPKVVIMGFVNYHITDHYQLKIRRLGRHFVAQNDLPELWSSELHDFHRCAQTSLAHYSSLMGDQPEHQLYILDYLVPHYKAGVRINNDVIDAQRQRRIETTSEAEGATAKAPTYERIKRFSDMMKQRGIELWFVPMPQPEFYELPEGCEDVIRECGIHFRDARSIPGMTEADFSDGYHLGETGKKKFTQWMHGQLDQHLIEGAQ